MAQVGQLDRHVGAAAVVVCPRHVAAQMGDALPAAVMLRQG
jgi:hypothetical protein